MGATEILKLLITADTQGAVSGLKKVGDTTTTQLGKSQATIDKWGSGFSKAGVGMVAFGAVALAGLGAMAKRSEEANLSTVKLQNSLAANPRLAGTSAKGFIDLAQAIQSKTAADGDDIVAGMAVLAQGKLQAAQIKELTPLVVDLARKKGIDETAAFTLASKAVQGNAGALKRAGIAVDETAFKTDAFGATVTALRTSVGGFANAEGKTFAGSLARMKNELGDVEETVGKGAVDAFTSLFGAVGKAAGALESISPGAQAAAGKIATFGAVGLVAAGAASTLIGKAIEARAMFAALGGQLALMPARLGALVPSITAVEASMAGAEAATIGFEGSLSTLLGPAAAVVAGLIALRSVVKSTEHGLADEQIDQMAKSLDRLGKSGQVSGDALKSTLSTISNVGGGGLDPGGKMSRSIDDLDKALAKLAGEDPKAATRAFDAVIERLSDETGVSKKALAASSAFDDYKRAVKGAGDVQGGASSAIAGTGQALNDQAAAADLASQKAQDYHDKIAALFDPLLGYRDALAENVQAQGDFNAKAMEAAAAQDAFTDAVKKHGPHSKEAMEASMAYMAAVAAQGEAQDKTVDSALGLDSAMRDLRLEIEKNPKAADDAKAKLAEMARQHSITGEQAMIAGAKIDGFVAAANKTPAKKSTQVSVVGVNAAEQGIAGVKEALAGLHDKTVSIHFAAFGGVPTLGNLLGIGHAAGGRVKAGVPGLVGERGPELFVPDQNGTIIPNSALSRGPVGHSGMAGSYVDNRTFNINVHGGDPQAVVSALSKYVRNNGTGKLQRIVNGGG